MQKWLEEDWAFTVTVKTGESRDCRMGFETGGHLFQQLRMSRRILPKDHAGFVHIARDCSLWGEFYVTGK